MYRTSYSRRGRLFRVTVFTIPRARYQGSALDPPCGALPCRGLSPGRGASVVEPWCASAQNHRARCGTVSWRPRLARPRARRCSTIACRPTRLAPNGRGRWLAGQAERVHSAASKCAPSGASARTGVAAPLSRLARYRSRSAPAPPRRLALHSAQELAVAARAGGQRKGWRSHRQAARRAVLQVAPGGRVPCRRELERRVAAVRLRRGAATASDGFAREPPISLGFWGEEPIRKAAAPKTCPHSPARQAQPKRERGDCWEFISLQSPEVNSERHMCR